MESEWIIAGLAALVGLMAIERAVFGIMTARERYRLLDRIQARDLGEYKALEQSARRERRQAKRSEERGEVALWEPRDEVAPQVYTAAIAAERALFD